MAVAADRVRCRHPSLDHPTRRVTPLGSVPHVSRRVSKGGCSTTIHAVGRTCQLGATHIPRGFQGPSAAGDGHARHAPLVAVLWVWSAYVVLLERLSQKDCARTSEGYSPG